jgi:hypothetical protein
MPRLMGIRLEEMLAEGEGFEPPVPFQYQWFRKPEEPYGNGWIQTSQFIRLPAAF